MDGRKHPPATEAYYHGHSVGWMEGKVLVVETTNYSPKTTFRFPVAPESLRSVERFTRAAADRIDYQFTINDPTTYTRPWTAVLPMTSLPDYVIYEYACHEGNYAIEHGLSGARNLEKAAVQAAKKE